MAVTREEMAQAFGVPVEMLTGALRIALNRVALGQAQALLEQARSRSAVLLEPQRQALSVEEARHAGLLARLAALVGELEAGREAVLPDLAAVLAELEG